MELRKIAARALVAAVGVWLVASGCGGGGTGGRDITIDEPVQLSRTFENGQTLKYKLKSAGEMAVAMQGYDRVANTQTEFRTTCVFSNTDTDEINLAMRFDHAASSISVGDQVIVQESASALRGKTLDVSLAPDGQVLSFSGMAGEEYFEEGVGQLALMIHGMFPKLPEEPITIGYTWEDDLNIPDITSSTDRDFFGETTYTVIGFKEKYGISCVEVATVSTFEFEGRVEQQGEAWLMSGSGESEGVVLFSMEDGLVIFSKSDTAIEFEGEGSTTAGAGASTTLSAGMTVQGTLELL
ncbi:MAG: hypothetical protein KAW67_08295 [Candidatus Eisenbacteria sp.]|nr:hypothetical protein [Candidatus Eisenbacteria bacterium]